jgi:hypothetical protein
MLLCAAGDSHGAIDRLYADVLAFEGALGRSFDHVLHVGDLGVWPDPRRIDKATRNHDGAGDFPTWFAQERPVPTPTVFVKGNHEDFDWLEQRRRAGELEILPGLTYLPNGDVLALEHDGDRLRIGGIGGCHGPSDYDRPSSTLKQRARRHFTRDEVERLCSREPIDVLLLHDAPAAVEFVWRHKDGSVRRRFSSEAHGHDDAIARIRPRLVLFGHHHTRLDVDVHGVRCMGLNKVRCPGNLVAIEIDGAAGSFTALGEWPPRAETGRAHRGGELS